MLGKIVATLLKDETKIESTAKQNFAVSQTFCLPRARRAPSSTAVLQSQGNIMRLINTTSLELDEFFDSNIPKYAIYLIVGKQTR